MIGCFTESFVRDLQLPRSAVASVFMVSIVGSSLYANMVGYMADRQGAPLLVMVAAPLYAAALLGLSYVRSLHGLQAFFLLVRMLGPETIDFACRLCVTQWWTERRGFAFGILNLVGAGMSVLPPLLALAIEAAGWRATLRYMALYMGGAALGVSSLLLRRPEDSGRSRPVAAAKDGAAAEDALELTLSGAIRTSGFWVMQAFYLLCGGAWNALNFHSGALLREQVGALTEVEARSWTYVPLAIASALAALVGGVLADGLPDRRRQLALLAPALSMGACVGAFSFVRRAEHLVGVGVALGCYQGLEKTISAVVAASLFGRRHNGRIEACLLITRQLSGALGVQALGAVKDALGTFRPALGAIAFGLTMLCVGIAITTPTAGGHTRETALKRA